MGLTVPLPAEVGPTVGLLCDRDIKRAVSLGFLFERAGFSEENAKYASYEIRIGTEYQILRYEGDDVVHVPKSVPLSGSIDIEPGATFLIVAEELFRVPTNIFAKITTLGQVFSSGLAAENTFADPGYTGPLYITMTNVSGRTLSLKRGDPLARVEFHKFEHTPERTHVGFNGRRKNFISAKIDTKIRELLRTKTSKELLQEMINESLDEALQSRFARSEVLIEKAHYEIDSLQITQATLRRVQWYSAIVVSLLVFMALQQIGLFKHVNVTDMTKTLIDLFVAFLAGVLSFAVDRKYLSKWL